MSLRTSGLSLFKSQSKAGFGFYPSIREDKPSAWVGFVYKISPRNPTVCLKLNIKAGFSNILS